MYHCDRNIILHCPFFFQIRADNESNILHKADDDDKDSNDDNNKDEVMIF